MAVVNFKYPDGKVESKPLISAINKNGTEVTVIDLERTDNGHKVTGVSYNSDGFYHNIVEQPKWDEIRGYLVDSIHGTLTDQDYQVVSEINVSADPYRQLALRDANFESLANNYDAYLSRVNSTNMTVSGTSTLENVQPEAINAFPPMDGIKENLENTVVQDSVGIAPQSYIPSNEPAVTSDIPSQTPEQIVPVSGEGIADLNNGAMNIPQPESMVNLESEAVNMDGSASLNPGEGIINLNSGNDLQGQASVNNDTLGQQQIQNEAIPLSDLIADAPVNEIPSQTPEQVVPVSGEGIADLNNGAMNIPQPESMVNLESEVVNMNGTTLPSQNEVVSDFNTQPVVGDSVFNIAPVGPVTNDTALQQDTVSIMDAQIDNNQQVADITTFAQAPNEIVNNDLTTLTTSNDSIVTNSYMNNFDEIKVAMDEFADASIAQIINIRDTFKSKVDELATKAKGSLEEAKAYGELAKNTFDKAQNNIANMGLDQNVTTNQDDPTLKLAA